MQMTILLAVIVFVIVTLILVALLLFIKTKLTPSGTVKININEGSKIVEVTPGGNLLSTLAEQKIFLPSACGGKGACGQCKCRVTEGGGEILPTEVGFFNRKQIAAKWRLGCQVKIKENMSIEVRFTRHKEHMSYEGTSRMLSITKTTVYKDLCEKMVKVVK